MKTKYRHQSHNKSRSTELRLMQKYVTVYMFIFIAFNNYNVIRYTDSCFYFIPTFISDSWGGEKNSRNLGRDSKCLRNNGLIDNIPNK
jgi:hypothetical protein